MRLNSLHVARLALALKGPPRGEARDFARSQNHEFRGDARAASTGSSEENDTLNQPVDSFCQTRPVSAALAECPAGQVIRNVSGIFLDAVAASCIRTRRGGTQRHHNSDRCGTLPGVRRGFPCEPLPVSLKHKQACQSGGSSQRRISGRSSCRK
jgi:hypothetical protein